MVHASQANQHATHIRCVCCLTWRVGLLLLNHESADHSLPCTPLYTLCAAPQMAADQLLGESVRQELFSFAAASCLDLGNPERLALLNRWGSCRPLMPD